jgi:hypothetical protein
MFKSSFTCDFEGCGKYLDSPVTLPCGFTICLQHIENRINFECSKCKIEHKSIDENGFRINYKLSDIINYNHHLDGKHKEVKVLYDKLESSVNEFKKSNLADPDTFIYDYFSNLRNQIDLHREEMMRKINKKSEKILKELSDLENELKENKKNVERIQIDKYIEQDLNLKLREPNLKQDFLLRIQKDLTTKIYDLEARRQLYEKDLKMNHDIEFEKSNDTSFGILRIIPLGILKRSNTYINKPAYLINGNLNYSFS